MERQVSIDIVDSPAVVDAFPFRLMVAAMLGWLDRRQQETVAYPMEENRLLRKLAYLRSRASSKESLSLSVFSDLVDRFTAGLFGLATESVDTAASLRTYLADQAVLSWNSIREWLFRMEALRDVLELPTKSAR